MKKRIEKTVQVSNKGIAKVEGKETSNVITAEQQKNAELIQRSREKLRVLGLNHSVLSDSDVVSFAKKYLDMEQRIETAVEDRQQESKKIKADIEARWKQETEQLATDLYDLAKASIENKPQKSFSSRIKTNEGDIQISLNCYQDTEKPEVKQMITAKQTFEKRLTNMVEAYGISKVKKLLTTDKGTKKGFSYTVFKGIRKKKGFDRIPITVNDLKFNLSLGWADVEEETK